jgi:CMP-N-acetylneuraminic acid synthetase
MKLLALVTAKSQSSRFAYKNKQVLHGKPLYKWTTDFLEDNRGFFDSLVFSSDRPHSFNLGDGWLRVIRPQYLIEDTTPHICSVKHALVEAEYINSKKYDIVMLFQPTNPLRGVKLLYDALALLENNRSCCYWSRCLYVDPNLKKTYILDAPLGYNVGNPIIKSGVLYVYNRELLLEYSKFETEENHMMVSKEMGYNINDELDFKIVEAMMKHRGVKYGGRC